MCYTRLEILMMKIQIVVFRLMTPCSDVVEYQRFGGSCCLHLQGEVTYTYAHFPSTIHFTLKIEAAWFSRTLVSYHITK
jgi:hypothetical protein